MLGLVALLIAGQCGPNGCVVPVSPAAPRENVYQWHETGTPNQIALYRDGVQIGNYYVKEKKYTRYENGVWTTREQGPPVPPPESAALIGDKVAAYPNYGIDLDKINRDKSYSVNGRVSSRDDALERIAGKLLDDSGKMFLTIIGSKEDCAAVQKDLDTAPALKEIKDRVHLHCYEPSDPMVAKSGFVTSGKPTIYVQAAGDSGKVLHRQDNYDGPEKLAEAVRKADKDYKPASDPNLNDSLSQLKAIPGGVWLIAGLGVLIFLSQKKAV